MIRALLFLFLFWSSAALAQSTETFSQYLQGLGVGTNVPLIFTGTILGSGTRSGNTTKFATVTGSTSNGHCITWDSSGNLIDGGGTCVSSSSGVNAGTQNQLAFYAANGSVVSGVTTCNNGLYVTNGTGVPSCGNTISGTLSITGATLTVPAQLAATILFGSDSSMWAHQANQFWGASAGNPASNVGSDNIGIGTTTMAAITSGIDNIAIGSETMRFATTAGTNVCIGFEACHGNPFTGSNNLAFGSQALFAVTTGSNNTAIGTASAFTLTTGSLNIALGAGLSSITTGSRNIGIDGTNALATLTSGTDNIAIGNNSCNGVTTEHGDICIGKYTGTSLAGFNDVIVFSDGDGNLRLDYGFSTAGVWSMQGAVAVGGGGGAMSSNELGFSRYTGSNTAPGAGNGAKLHFVCGTNAGTLKLVALAGTSSTPTTVIDNIGGGVTGC